MALHPVERQHIKEWGEKVRADREHPLRQKVLRIIQNVAPHQEEVTLAWLKRAMESATSDKTRNFISQHYYKLRNKHYASSRGTT